jgi:excisionase family DNA binding protein
MAQRYYNIEKAAEVLGISPAEVNRLRERNELHAYRDGADWKFKAEEVEEYQARQRAGTDSSTGQSDILTPDDSGDVLFSEVELGGSDPGTSGTVIGPTIGAAPDSDVQLTDSEINLAGSGLHLSDELVQPSGLMPSSSIAKADDLELTLDADLTLEDSRVPLISQPTTAGFGTSESSLELAEVGGLDDDDLVLGGSGSGSDITIGGDSGISLVDPTDSGLSLEEPLEVSTPEESLELGEDDMLTLGEESSPESSESPTQLKADSDFLLTPMEEAPGEDAESSSQVIALDAESEIDDSAATMATSMSGIGMAGVSGVGRPVPMLDAESSDSGLDIEAVPAAAVAAAPRPVYADVAASQAAMAQAAVAIPETPYPAWVVAFLVFATLFLMLAGMMSFDLLRNMWSWNGPYTFNSSIMDAILGLFG